MGYSSNANTKIRLCYDKKTEEGLLKQAFSGQKCSVIYLVYHLLSRISIHHRAQTKKVGVYWASQHHVYSNTATDWIRLVEPLIANAACTSLVSVASCAVVGKTCFWCFHINQEQGAMRGENQRGKRGDFFYTSKSTNRNKKETAGPMLSNGPNGNWKRV